MSKNIFITGTGTDVGKTFVTGLIVKKLRENGLSAGYYKAAMSGNERAEDGTLIPGDALWVKRVSGIRQPLSEMCPYIYETAVSPHLASRIEGNPVRMEEVKKGFSEACRKYDFVTMEGSGGILCPIDSPAGEKGAFYGEGLGGEAQKQESGQKDALQKREIWLEDVIRELGLSSLIVADAGLGTINSVVLTAEYMRAKGLPVKGIIFNHFHPGDQMEEDNLRMCEYRTGLPVIACVEDGSGELNIEVERLTALYE